MRDLSTRFPVWFCDIWGVVHDGVHVDRGTLECLVNHRKTGKVILVSNSPRTNLGVERQLDQVGVPRQAYDAVVTSGEVTRALIAQYKRVFHLGPERDLSIFEGLAVQRVKLEDAEAIACTGLFDDRAETPADYTGLLESALHLPMICANPDKTYRTGGLTLPCAGSVAERFAQMGGKVSMAGKPYAPIYELALKTAGDPPKSKILGIGDGAETDVKGAADFGIACVYVCDVPDPRAIRTVAQLLWT